MNPSTSQTPRAGRSPSSELERLDGPKFLESADARRVVAMNDIFAPIRLLGAEIYLAEKAAARSGGRDIAEGFLNHVSQSEYAFQLLVRENVETEDGVDIRKAHALLVKLKANVCDWMNRGFGNAASHFETIGELYRELSAETVLSSVEHARDQKLTLLEFHVEYSGIPFDVIPAIVELEQELLIDPSIKKPQEGFARVLETPELTQILRCKGARLFCLMRDDTAFGFYVFLPVSRSVPEEVREIYTELKSRAVLGEDFACGWCEIMGISHRGRVALRRQGIDGHQILDQVVVQTALYENLDLLLGYVRDGNRSKAAHFRRGWIPSGYRFHGGADGITPYEVIARSIGDGRRAVLNPEPDLGDRPHHRPRAAFQDNDTRILGAPPMSDEEALRRCSEFAKRIYWDFHVTSAHGSLGFYITFKLINAHYNLHQLRPRTDLWRNYGTGYEGSLDQVLGRIEKEFPW